MLAALLIGALNRGGLFVDIFTDKVSKDLVVVLAGRLSFCSWPWRLCFVVNWRDSFRDEPETVAKEGYVDRIGTFPMVCRH